MKIKRLVIEGLFERNYDIKFYDDITLLYGVNGSGKTTILNILSTIISGDLLDLGRYDFKYLELTVSRENEEGINEEKIYIKETTHNVPMYHIQFRDRMAIIPKEIDERHIEFEDMGYAKRKISQEEIYMKPDGILEVKEDYFDKYYTELVYEIKESFYQLYIPLTRKSVSNNKLQRRSMSLDTKVNNYSDANTYLDNSVKVAVRQLRDYRVRVTMRENRILERLKRQILKLALASNEVEINNFNLDEIIYFNDELSDMSSISDFDIPIEQNLDALTGRLESYRGSFEIDLNNNIHIVDPMGFANFVAAMSQLNKFAQIAKEVKKANNRREHAGLPVSQLIKIINQFLKDGEKEVFLDSGNILKFRRKGSSKKQSIGVMSSGEKQIVIFFIYVILGVAAEKRKGIFIIDEPELSLHVEWQNKFIPNLIKAAGDTQLILATHSPEIIGDRTARCVEVRGVL
ncbi:AAA family ATPase [Bacillus thuringiensis]|uniref:AAA family ATPase n=1 Tax=Bacillus thuringiensis TaxID=1428 RepID=UPI000BFC8D8F|nr:AAA family ATPase [Bacillus thuringiensis]PGW37822.1 hypothetical protein COE17_20465 [Bacillus thuringiensis]